MPTTAISRYKGKIIRALKGVKVRPVKGKALAKRILGTLPEILRVAMITGQDAVPVLHGVDYCAGYVAVMYDEVAAKEIRRVCKAMGIRTTEPYTLSCEKTLFDDNVEVTTYTLLVHVPDEETVARWARPKRRVAKKAAPMGSR